MKVVMIGGTGRSGTNILKKILSVDKDSFALPFEHRFTIDPDGIVDFYNSFSSTWSPYMADKKIKRLENYLLGLSKRKSLSHMPGKLYKTIKGGRAVSPASYHGWELSKWFPLYEKNVKEMISELRSFEYKGIWPGTSSYSVNNHVYFSDKYGRKQLAKILGGFLEKTIASALKKQKKQVFIEDNTWNILFAKELFELMPGSCLIHAIRDPRDVVASLKEQRWAPHDTRQTIIFYRSIMDRWLIIKNSLSEERLLEFRFEDLVSGQEKTIKGICSFAGIRFDKRMLMISEDKAHIGRWVHDFPEEEKRFLEKELREYISSLGYR